MDQSSDRLVSADVLVVGAGAACCMAALAARHGGAKVILIEKEERIGKKILISGGGKCNLTNAKVQIENFHGTHPRFVQDALRSFDEGDLLQWLESIGVETWTDEANGKVWPVAMKSHVVTDAIEDELEHAGVELWLNSPLTGIEPHSSGVGYQCSVGEVEQIHAKTVVLATGGTAAPQLGADDSGLRICEQLGHKLVARFPALVGLIVAEAWTRELKGLTCEDVSLTLEVGGKAVLTTRGSLLFTHYGITSPAIFRLSREVEAAKAEGQVVRVLINFRPDMIHNEADALNMLHHVLGSNTKKHSGTVAGYVVGYRRLGDVLIKQIGADPEKRVRELQHGHRVALASLVAQCPLTIASTQGWPKAEVMRGGVDVRKIHPRTMESRILPGLFVCGEMLDIDGDVGVFNFQFAFASGFVAGKTAAETALATQ